MATIQIRDIPDEDYEAIRRQARALGQSIESYVRDQVIDRARRPTCDEALDAVEAGLAASDTPGSDLDRIVEYVREVRGR